MKDIKDFFRAKVVEEKTEEVFASNERPNRKRRKNPKYDTNDEDEQIIPNKNKSNKKHKRSAEVVDESGNRAQKTKRRSKRKISECVEDNNSTDSKLDALVVDVSSTDSRDSSENCSVGKKKRKISSELSPLNETEMPEYSPPSANNSLLNYFCKVDKSQTPTNSKIEKPNVLKVKALVHEPPGLDNDQKKERSPKFEEIKMKLKESFRSGRKKKKKSNKEEYDLIISESINVQCSVLEDESKNRQSANSVIIDLIEENSNSTLNREGVKLKPKIKHNGMLTSFFSVGDRIPKPVIELSEDRKIARQNFLLSGSPAPIKKITSSVNNQSTGASAPLPKISHVFQKDAMHLIWNLSSVDMKFKSPNHQVMVPRWSSISRINDDERITQRESQLKSTIDQKKELKRLKDELNVGNGSLPISSWFKDLRELKKRNEGQMWSEKYKPQSVSHLLLADIGNVDKFRSWLTKLKENATKEETEEVDSDDDFVNGDSCDSISKFKRAALLTGPSGIGKTAIVYAVANELGYKVLELNASANRTGKRILHEFSEALQSHKVETNQIVDIVSKKSKKKKESTPSIPNQSLILVEDADLLFTDYDDGFLSTAATLAASSKRPVVFITNERKCKQLLTKVSSHLEIDLNFSSLRRDHFITWLRVVGIAENVVLNPSQAERLVSWCNNYDAKKCLLQLEFSRTGISNNCYVDDDCSLAGAWGEIGNSAMPDGSVNDVLRRRCLSLLALTDLMVSSLPNHQKKNSNLCRRPWDIDERDGTELCCPRVNIEPDRVTEEIASHYLASISNVMKGQERKHSLTNQPSTIAEMEQCLLSPLNCLNRSAVALDFAPTLRGIARLEETRFSSQTKRNNRYFHYLQPDSSKTAIKMDYRLLVTPFETPDNNQELLLPT